MTAIKLDSKLPTSAVPDELAKRMYDGLGGHHMAIVDLRVTERIEPADGLDVEDSAKVRIVGLEFASDSPDADRLREAMRDRFAARTAADTLDEDRIFRDPTNPSVGFHEALLATLTERGQIGGYPITVEYGQHGGIVIMIDAEKADV